MYQATIDINYVIYRCWKSKEISHLNTHKVIVINCILISQSFCSSLS